MAFGLIAHRKRQEDSRQVHIAKDGKEVSGHKSFIILGNLDFAIRLQLIYEPANKSWPQRTGFAGSPLMFLHNFSRFHTMSV